MCDLQKEIGAMREKLGVMETKMKDSEAKVVVMTHDHRTSHDTADNGGNAMFLQLQQGDQVCVRLETNTYVWGNY